MRTAILTLRTVLLIDFVLFGLSFWPRFEGTASQVGLSDRYFEGLTFGGFRCDFVWLVVSTFGVLIAAVYLKRASRENPNLKIDAYLCFAWLVAFIVYLVRLAATGLIYFG